MPLASRLGVVPACVLLIVLPGPSVALFVGASLRHCRGAGLAALGGRLRAMVVRVTVTILGRSAAIMAAVHVFAVLRRAGVARSGDAVRQHLPLPTAFPVIAAALGAGRVRLAYRAGDLSALRPSWRNRTNGICRICLTGTAGGFALVEDAS